MSAQIPTPAALAQRFVSALAQQTFVASDGSVVTLDATAPATMESALAILSGLSDYEVYLSLRDQLLELMVTTATVTPGTGLLPKHAEIWGVPRLPAAAAIGNFLVTSQASAAITLPTGSLITVDGSAQWSVTEAVTISPGATAPVAVVATVAGTSGNLAANTAATLVSPIAGVSTIVSDGDGLAGGAVIEAVESWRARIIDEIRNPDAGGTVANYEKWAKAAGAATVNVVPGWLGRGSVGVIVALTRGVTPTAAQVAAVQAYIDTKRPVRGNVTVFGAVTVAQDLTLTLNPDTQSARAAVTAALTTYYLGLSIGATIYREGVDATITAVAGTQNTLLLPAGNVVLAVNQQAVLGTISWATAS